MKTNPLPGRSHEMKSKTALSMLALGFLLAISAGCADTSDYPEDLIVISSSPASGQTNISQTADVRLRFSEPVDHQTIVGTNQIILVDQSNSPVPVSFTFVGENVTVTPASPFSPNSTYGVAVRPGVRDIYGNNIATPFAATFATGSALTTIPGFPPFSLTPPPAPGTGGIPGTFSPTQPMVFARARHTLTTLIDGKILAIGGQNDLPHGRTLRSAETFDPKTLRWTLSNSLGTGINGMNFERYGHTATLLLDGRVLVAGGHNNAAVWDNAEIYDAKNDIFNSVICNMTKPRAFHTANLMENGNVILIAGYNNRDTNGSWFEDTMEVYDVASGTFTATAVNLLPNVVINGPLPSQQWSTPMGRAYHISESLPDHSILVAGGYIFPFVLQALTTANAQMYKPDMSGSGIKGTIQMTATTMTVPRVAHTSNIYYSGEAAGLVTIWGGFENSPFQGILQSGEVFDYSQKVTSGQNTGQSGIFTPLAQQTSITRWGHTSTIIPGGMHAGSILITGGAQHMPPQDWNNGLPNTRTYIWLDWPACIGCNATRVTDRFDPFGFGKHLNEPFRGVNVTGSCGPTQDINGNTTTLAQALYPAAGVFYHKAIGLNNGAVLICGGVTCAGCIPAPWQWVTVAGAAQGGISYQGRSCVYNP